MSDIDLIVAEAVRHAVRAATQTVARLSQENDVLHRENFRLKRELGKARLLTDLRRDQAEILNVQTPALLRRQAE